VIILNNMFLIGSTGRDAGKTTFACEMVRRFSDMSPVAAKVTVIRENDGNCPRGGAGCGVCSSLQGNYLITEETISHGNKDTQRLLAAGAKHVFWLRVLQRELENGVHALLDILGPNVPIICESNSLRHAVVPGLFIMVQRRDSESVKESARKVRHLADALIYSDGHSFDIDLKRITWFEGRWLLQ
jgi:hypothetical protein